MSLRSFSIVWEGSEAKGSALIVLLCLAEHWDSRRGYAYPGLERLARYARVSVRTAQEKIKELETLGEISISYGGGAQNTNRYYLNFKKLKAAADRKNAAVEGLNNPADSAPFSKEKTPQNPENPAESRTDFDKKPRRLPQKTPQLAYADCGGRLKDNLKKYKEGGEGTREGNPPPSPDFEFCLDALRELFPHAPKRLSPTEEGFLKIWKSELLEMEPDDWNAAACWFLHTDDQTRRRKKWPRSRCEFLEHFAEAMEKIRQWWTEVGAQWWNARIAREKRKAEQEARKTPHQPMSREEAIKFLES